MIRLVMTNILPNGFTLLTYSYSVLNIRDHYINAIIQVRYKLWGWILIIYFWIGKLMWKFS